MYPNFTITLSENDLRHLSLNIKEWQKTGKIAPNSHLELWLNTLDHAMIAFAEAVQYHKKAVE